MKRISILGSTGSIGTQTLSVVAGLPDHFRVEALAAGANLDLLFQQIRQFRPRMVSVSTKALADKLSRMLDGVPIDKPEIHCGEEGLLKTAAENDADIVVTAVVGSMGLKPTIAAIRAGKTIALANKETLVCAGEIVMRLAHECAVPILPVDSEHSAIFQCLHGESRHSLHKIVLTASGGSFRHLSREQLADVTVEQALNHPNWNMGAKITIDSATMVNKGLEVMEARWLFDVDFDQIEVVLHPQSIVHSLVEFKDHSVLAQLGYPDMRIPIQYALAYPERLPNTMKSLDLTKIGRLDFAPMDYERFRCLRMAFDCGRTGGTMPAVFNAANEEAVAAFLRGEISFLEIEDLIERSLSRHDSRKNPQLEEILEADRWARETVRQALVSRQEVMISLEDRQRQIGRNGQEEENARDSGSGFADDSDVFHTRGEP